MYSTLFGLVWFGCVAFALHSMFIGFCVVYLSSHAIERDSSMESKEQAAANSLKSNSLSTQKKQKMCKEKRRKSREITFANVEFQMHMQRKPKEQRKIVRPDKVKDVNCTQEHTLTRIYTYIEYVKHPRFYAGISLVGKVEESGTIIIAWW